MAIKSLSKGTLRAGLQIRSIEKGEIFVSKSLISVKTTESLQISNLLFLLSHRQDICSFKNIGFKNLHALMKEFFTNRQK